MESLLLNEIHEQPAVIRRLLEAEGKHVSEIGHKLAKKDIRYVFIAARGTSDNAARYGQYLFGTLNRLPVALAAPSLFSVFQQPPRLDGALVIGISQSGQSPDIASVLEEARKQGLPTIAVTNQPDSPLARAAEATICLHAGAENSVAATKTYTAQLTVLAMLAMAMSGQSLLKGLLDHLPDQMEKALESNEAAKTAAWAVPPADRCAVLGRGFNYATAYEIALKIKELSYVVADPYSSADFRHGPIAMVEVGFPVLTLGVGATMRAELLKLYEELKGRGARAILFDEESGTGLDRSVPADLRVPVPTAGLPEFLTPMTAILPGQLFAYHLACARGFNPDQPRTIQKVTLTR